MRYSESYCYYNKVKDLLSLSFEQETYPNSWNYPGTLHKWQYILEELESRYIHLSYTPGTIRESLTYFPNRFTFFIFLITKANFPSYFKGHCHESLRFFFLFYRPNQTKTDHATFLYLNFNVYANVFSKFILIKYCLHC
jgi:hypothetical protein